MTELSNLDSMHEQLLELSSLDFKKCPSCGSDNSQFLNVKIYINGEEKGNANYCEDLNLHEWFWKEKAIGPYILTITAEDSFKEIGSTEIIVWNLCLIE